MHLLIFELSYLGWWLLNDITGGIVGLLYVTPYYNMTKALVFEELKGRAIALMASRAVSLEGSGLTIAIKPEDVAEKSTTLETELSRRKSGASLLRRRMRLHFWVFLVCMQAQLPTYAGSDR